MRLSRGASSSKRMRWKSKTWTFSHSN
jgi:hypothetical protein